MSTMGKGQSPAGGERIRLHAIGRVYATVILSNMGITISNIMSSAEIADSDIVYARLV